ncbi:hypothetical protein C8R46DRAFT_467794 [Mycena filopes]|nr:hypothetical protein C8R46DRAFT_467794 [Mycena filopes]
MAPRSSLPGMLTLPLELVGEIISFLSPTDLRSLVQVCATLRALATLPLLCAYGISPSQIHSGSVCVADGVYFLIPMIYNIHPIQKLQILPLFPLRVLADVLDTLPPIPDVLVSGRLIREDLGVRRVIAASFRAVDGPAIVVNEGRFWAIHGAQSHSRPVQSLVGWNARPRTAFANRDFLSVLILNMPFVLMSIISTVYHLVLDILAPEDRKLRIPTHLPNSMSTRSTAMHIQIVSVPGGGQLLLVLFSSDTRTRLSIPRLPGISPAQMTAVLAALQIEDRMPSLTVTTNAAIKPHALLDFVRRHPSLREVTLEPGALSLIPASPNETSLIDAGSWVQSVCAPAEYIPHILPIVRYLEEFTITFLYPAHLASALANLTATHLNLQTLTLNFGRPSAHAPMPWHSAPHPIAVVAGEGGMQTLPSVRYLDLVGEFDGYSHAQVDVTGLPLWLARFPALVRLQLWGRWVRLEEEEHLVCAINGARARSKHNDAWEGVLFL